MIYFDWFVLYECLCVLLPCLLYFGLKKEKGSRLYGLCLFVFLLYIWQVLSLTGSGGIDDIRYFWQNDGVSGILRGPVELIPFSDLDISFVLNIVMCVPLGFALPFLWRDYRKLSRTVLLGAGFSLLIEISQLVNHRATDINDLIANTVGALLGYLLWRLFAACLGERLRKTTDGCRDAVIYLALGFFGRFFLYCPFLIIGLLGI